MLKKSAKDITFSSPVFQSPDDCTFDSGEELGLQGRAGWQDWHFRTGAGLRELENVMSMPRVAGVKLQSGGKFVAVLS